MKELKIIITITNPEILEDYSDVHPDLIGDDVYNDPKGWVQSGSIEVVKVEEGE